MADSASKLTETSFRLLLERLDADLVMAGEKYIELQAKLKRFFARKGCKESVWDELADTTLNRVARKLEEKVVIENISAYSLQVARFIFLENFNKTKEVDPGPEPLEPWFIPKPDETDLETVCLRSCLAELPDTDRQTFIDYHVQIHEESKLKKQRQSLAELLGIEINALRQRMNRLREKLEDCIAGCVKKKNAGVIK